MHREPDVGFDPTSPGSRPGPKAGAKPLRHPGIPRSLTFMGRSIRVTADVSTATWQPRKGWQDIFRVLHEKNMQTRILYPARLSFKMEGEIKSFQDRQELKEYVTSKPALQDFKGDS